MEQGRAAGGFEFVPEASVREDAFAEPGGDPAG